MRWSAQVPVSFFQKASAEPGKQRRIGGIASDETEDSQGEEVLARALDFTPFLHGGWFNDNHSKKTADVVGYPEAAKMFRKGQKLPDGSNASANGWWVEGYLLETPEADRIWTLGKALQKTDRRLGFSLEGSIDKRSGPKTVWKKSDEGTGGKWVGKKIVKATVRNVAITNCPVHKGSRMEVLAKSLIAAENGEDEDELEKMLAMGPVAAPGQAVVGPRVGVGAGQIITGQSLERKKRPALQKGLSDAEALRWVQSRAPTMPKAAVVRFIAITRQLKRAGAL